jgi:hypothetical protein
MRRVPDFFVGGLIAARCARLRGCLGTTLGTTRGAPREGYLTRHTRSARVGQREQMHRPPGVPSSTGNPVNPATGRAVERQAAHLWAVSRRLTSKPGVGLRMVQTDQVGLGRVLGPERQREVSAGSLTLSVSLGSDASSPRPLAIMRQGVVGRAHRGGLVPSGR